MEELGVAVKGGGPQDVNLDPPRLQRPGEDQAITAVVTAPGNDEHFTSKPYVPQVGAAE